MSTERPLVIDLFAGAGGLSYGFESAGFDIGAAVEYDPIHAAVHEFNFPTTETICADLSNVNGHELAARVERKFPGRRIDVVCGGPPCQGFSYIGKRLIDDERNQLVFHFLRIISEIRPRYFVMENVPGMVSGGHTGIVKQLISEFEDAGYRICGDENLKSKILDASCFGVPQARRRLFLIGTRDDQPDVEYPTPTVTPVPKRSGGSVRTSDRDLPLGPTVGDAIGDIPDLDQFLELISDDEITLSDEQRSKRDMSASLYARRLLGLDPDPGDLSYPRSWDSSTLTGSMRTSHTEKTISRFMKTPQGETEPISRFYRLDENGLCNTLRAGTGSERGAFTSARPIHPTLPRVISVREAARLHSFPDWFRFHKTKWHGFRQIGNSVAPLVGRAIALKLIEALRVSPEKPDATLTGDPKLLSLKMKEAVEFFDADPNQIPGGRKAVEPKP